MGKYSKHNHPPSPDPFQLTPRRHRRPGYIEAVRIAQMHRGVVISSSILGRLGLEIEAIKPRGSAYGIGLPRGRGRACRGR
jgi:hypothetical protein